MHGEPAVLVVLEFMDYTPEAWVQIGPVDLTETEGNTIDFERHGGEVASRW